MPTFLSQFADAEIKVRYKEPYLTAGLNEKQAAVIPSGIHRGFQLVPGGSNYEVGFQASDVALDHVALYETGTGYAIRIRKTGGDFVEDLSALAGGSDRVFVIAIYAQYVANSATTAVLRAYQLSPVDEFTGAAERGELVVLGEVTVPAIAAPITVINERYRSSAWEQVNIGVREPVQVVKNGDFELCSVDTPTSGEILWPCWDYPGATWTVNSFLEVVTSGTPRVGSKHLRISLGGVVGPPPQVAMLPYEGRYRIRGGCRIKGAFWTKRSGTVAPGANGHLGLRIQVYSSDATTVLATYYIDDLTPAAGYLETTRAFKTPSAARWMSVDVYFDDDGASSSGLLYFDDIRVWVEQPAIIGGQVDRFLPLHDAALTARSLDIAPNPGEYADLEGFLDRLLTLRHNTGAEYTMQRRRDVGDFLLTLINGGLKINNLIEDLGSSRIGSAAEGTQARITSPIPAAGTALYVLLWEIANAGSGGNIRIYATEIDSTFSRNTFVITVNAEWTGTQWAYDDAGYRASRYNFQSDRFMAAWKESGGTSPWNDFDWPDYTDSWPLWHVWRTRAGATLFDTYSRFRLLLSGTPTESDLEAGRIYVNTGDMTTSFRTCIMDLASVLDSSFAHARLYDSINTSLNYLEWVLNAKWNQTDSDYDKDDSGLDASRMRFIQNGYFAISRSTPGVDPFTDADWVTCFAALPSGANSETDVQIQDGDLRFMDVQLAGSNRALPAYDNVLYAANIPKAWLKVHVASGVLTVEDEFGIASLAFPTNTRITVTLDRAMDSSQFCVVASPRNGSAFAVGVESVSPTTFDVSAFDILGAGFHDFTLVTDATMNFIVFGRQS